MGEQDVFTHQISLLVLYFEHAPQNRTNRAVGIGGIGTELDVLPGLLFGLIALQLVG